MDSILVRWRAVLTGQYIGQMEGCVNWAVYSVLWCCLTRALIGFSERDLVAWQLEFTA